MERVGRPPWRTLAVNKRFLGLTINETALLQKSVEEFGSLGAFFMILDEEEHNNNDARDAEVFDYLLLAIFQQLSLLDELTTFVDIPPEPLVRRNVTLDSYAPDYCIQNFRFTNSDC